MIIRVPGSSANLGPGFDALGLAVGRHAEVALDAALLPGSRPADEHHPATIAYRIAGGSGALHVRTNLPMGRGLGYSGAVRVAGAIAGLLERRAVAVVDDDVRHEAVELTTELEGHADNVAASAFGGAVVAAGGAVARVPLAEAMELVVWIPSFTTSTDASRSTLPQTVSLADAAFNVGHVALFVAALATGRVDLLREAARDRLHQDQRLAAAPPSARALAAATDAGAWCAWLSGSGPTIAALVAPERVGAVLAGLPADGAGHRLVIDQSGATVI